MFKDKVIERMTKEFGSPSRDIVKITAWDITNSLGVVVQKDRPTKEDYAFVWLPYPPDTESLPEIALEYAAQSGRHGNTYASPGLESGKPALKLVVTNSQELDDLISYINAFKLFASLPELKANPEIVEFVIDDITLRAIKTRRGQPEFRKTLLLTYNGKCCISGCSIESVLEAAHIIPHSIETNYKISNGLLLRADIHTLFDLNLIGIDQKGTVQISVDLTDSEYESYRGVSLKQPMLAATKNNLEHRFNKYYLPRGR